jgi:hypothetical protein
VITSDAVSSNPASTSSTSATARTASTGRPPAAVAAADPTDPNDPNDPNDHVGSAVEADVVDAVGHTLRYAAGSAPYPDFTPPSTSVAFGG